MMRFGGGVVGAGGIDFVFEVSYGFVFAVVAYLGLPFLFVFVPCDSLVFRG